MFVFSVLSFPPISFCFGLHFMVVSPFFGPLIYFSFSFLFLFFKKSYFFLHEVVILDDFHSSIAKLLFYGLNLFYHDPCFPFNANYTLSRHFEPNFFLLFFNFPFLKENWRGLLC